MPATLKPDKSLKGLAGMVPIPLESTSRSSSRSSSPTPKSSAARAACSGARRACPISAAVMKDR
jgi:hypothetical protein